MTWGKRYDIAIGIDTGVKTGVAVWNKKKQEFELLKTMKLYEAMMLVDKYHSEGYNMIVVVEDARKATKYRRSAKDMVTQQGAGSVKRDAKAWEEFLKGKDIPYRMVRPNNKATKLDKETFFKYTGYKGSTSSHARDAAMMVYKYN